MLLLTRPIHDSQRIEKHLRKCNIPIHIDPLMEIERNPIPSLDLSNFQAIILTSANGVRAFFKKGQQCELPVYVVGNHTRTVALQHGLKTVVSSDGNVETLYHTLTSTLNPDDGPLLYLTGGNVAGTLYEDLRDSGFSINHQKIYTAVAAQCLSDDTKKLLKKGKIDYIPFYSPRSALIFKELIEAAHLQNTLAKVSVICISPAVENEISTLAWKEILTAKKPTQENMFKLINIKL